MRALLVLLVLTTACDPRIPDGAFVCTTSAECPPRQRCVAGVCRSDATDAGIDDTSAADAGEPPDAAADAPDATEPTDAGMPDARPSTDFVLRGSTWFHADDALTSEPLDWDERGVELRTLDATGALSAPFFPAGTGDTRTFSDVPEASAYYVTLNAAQYLVTAARYVEYDVHVLGRPRPIVAADPATAVTFQIGGLDPWQAGDVIEVLVNNANVYHYLPDGGDPSPAIGDTALVDYTVPWTGAALVRGGLGDRIEIFHNSTTTLPGGVVATTCRERFRAPIVEQDEGSTLVVTGSMLALADNTTVDVDWRTTAWAALGTFAGPGADTTLTSLVLDYQAQPNRTPELEGFSGTLDLLVLSSDGTADVLLPGTHFANPYAPVTLLRGVEVVFGATVEIPGLPPRRFGWPNTPRMGRVDAVEAGLDPVITPRVAPPTAIAVDGIMLDDTSRFPDVAADDTVTLSWTAPASLEAPTGYFVRVFEVYGASGGTVLGRTLAAFFRVEGPITSIVFPSGLLQPDRYYFALVESRIAPGPGEQPVAYASTISSVFHTVAP